MLSDTSVTALTNKDKRWLLWFEGYDTDNYISNKKERPDIINSRVILIEKIFFFSNGHVPKVFHSAHWYQNIFCFFSSSSPSPVGKIFISQHIIQIEFLWGWKHYTDSCDIKFFKFNIKWICIMFLYRFIWY